MKKNRSTFTIILTLASLFILFVIISQTALADFCHPLSPGSLTSGKNYSWSGPSDEAKFIITACYDRSPPPHDFTTCEDLGMKSFGSNYTSQRLSRTDEIHEVNFNKPSGATGAVVNHHWLWTNEGDEQFHSINFTITPHTDVTIGGYGGDELASVEIWDLPSYASMVEIPNINYTVTYAGSIFDGSSLGYIPSQYIEWCGPSREYLPLVSAALETPAPLPPTNTPPPLPPTQTPTPLSPTNTPAPLPTPVH